MPFCLIHLGPDTIIDARHLYVWMLVCLAVGMSRFIAVCMSVCPNARMFSSPPCWLITISYGITVLQQYGIMVLLYSVVMVLWYYSKTVIWYYVILVIWHYVIMVYLYTFITLYSCTIPLLQYFLQPLDNDKLNSLRVDKFGK